MKYLRLFANALLLLTVPSLAAYPQAELPAISYHSQPVGSNILTLSSGNYSYDDVLNLLDQIESGALEQSCSEQDLDRINEFLASLAQEGMISEDPSENYELACDIQDLLQQSNPYEYAFSYGNDYILVPMLYSSQGEYILCKSWFHKKWEQTKKFVKKHKKTIIIVAVAAVAVAAVVITAGVVAAAAPGLAGAAGAAKAEKDREDSDLEDKAPSPSATKPADISVLPAMRESPEIRSAFEGHLSALKHYASDEHGFFAPYDSKLPVDFSYEENARILGSVFAHRHLENGEGSKEKSLAHEQIDQKFSTDFAKHYAEPLRSSFSLDPDTALNADLYRLRGERALHLAHYDQAISDLGKTLTLNPYSSDAYLGRAKAHLAQGDYDRSLEDYQKYTVQKPVPPAHIVDFSIGFAKGLPQGAWESGGQLASFAYGVVAHPVDTGAEVWEAICLMSKLVYTQEWATIGKALSPEIHQLITEWDTLSPQEQGERAGFAFGKHGADFLLPGVIAKTASRAAAGGQEVLTAYRTLRGAEHTLLLEAVARSGTSAEELAEIAAKLARGERSGLAAKELTTEMAQLKQAGKLEGAINSSLERVISSSESNVLKVAIRQDRHVKMVRDYLGKPAKEIQKGINSYEKQIAVHKDKIANPTKYYPDWDKLDPRQRQALTNKKWPTEINGYEEQKSVLQSILNERLSYE